MGIWGTGLYSNDTSADVVDMCKEIYPFLPAEEANRKILEEHHALLAHDEDDDEVAFFWYALVDWQWNHGVLPEENKTVAIKMLEKRRGMKSWLKNTNYSNIRRRKAVLDALQAKLMSPQPKIKCPRAKLEKPKHKPGDIIIFKATEFVDKWDSTWHLRRFRSPIIFASDYISKSQNESITPVDAHGKYMAILCVGTQTSPHSNYVSDVFDVHSTYVWYNYLSSERPSIEELSNCGFLPFVIWKAKKRTNLTESISWGYTFSLFAETFLPDEYIYYADKKHSLNEVNRFNQMFLQKSYSNETYVVQDLNSMFYIAYEEITRMNSLRLKIDDLLDPAAKNPEFLSVHEIDRIFNQN